jgi:catechol 2,3-dioxygenase-like lactoylglutathione lyase family enzyme
LFTDPTNPTTLLRSVAYAVDDVDLLRKSLVAERVQFTEQKGPARGSHRLSVVDPEGHTLVFVATDLQPKPGLRIIHTGFIVRDQAAMDHFYKDILGFRPYWHGGMKDNETSWISLQVPDGTEWIEYMVNLPIDPDQRLRGIMNHIALGVPDIQAAREQLVHNGAHLTEEPKLGRDGKWQLNLYDPDQTRIEFMEFAPKEKPCCSEFTGPHPKP